jgi:hypothetical protein
VTDEGWVGDLGHLALADASLGALLIDMLGMLAHAGYPKEPGEVDHGQTTGNAARAVGRRLSSDPDLFPDDAAAWLAEVQAASESRNQLLHAVALNRCNTCGHATRFMHPRSGVEVDRSEATIQRLTARVLELNRLGGQIAEEVAKRANERIVKRARHEAEATDEIQSPPQVSAQHVTRVCGACAGDGVGNATVRLGTAVEVWPQARFRAFVDELRAGDVDE